MSKHLKTNLLDWRLITSLRCAQGFFFYFIPDLVKNKMLIVDENVYCIRMLHRISASRRKLTSHYEKDYSLLLAYLKPESLKFKSFTKAFYFNRLKMVMGCPWEWEMMQCLLWHFGRMQWFPFSWDPSILHVGRGS